MTNSEKEIVLKQMHSKFLGHQLLELLTDSARQAIEQQSKLYTWANLSGREEEVDGQTILALILARIRPNYKVDMYSEITKVKKQSIAMYNNDVQLFFDAIKYLKLHIDQKDPTAYTEDAFICDIFVQLKQESLPAEFWIEFGRQETRWMMNKTKITSSKLMEKAAGYYLNLKLTGAWKTEISKHSQIIALTTQISKMRSKLSKLAIAKTGTANRDTGKSDGGPGVIQPGGAGGGKYVFELWHLDKVNNNADHNMVECDGKTWYWCDKHTYNNKGTITQGMYVFHKPNEHDAWQAKKDCFGKETPKEISPANTYAKVNSAGSINTLAAKLSLSKSLQAALVTTAGLSEDQFKKIWDDACNASGN